MKLAVHERISLLNLLPQQANYVGVMALRKAKEIISFNEEEREYYKLHINDAGNWEWDGARASKRVADLPIEQYIVETVRKKLAEMDGSGTLTDQYISLYEKFIINYRAIE